MKIIPYITLLLLFLLPNTAKSQPFLAKKQKADKYYETGKFDKALPLYLEILEKYSNVEITEKVASIYYELENLEEVEYWYGQLVTFPNAKPLWFFNYVIALTQNQKCDLAEEWYQKTIKFDQTTDYSVFKKQYQSLKKQNCHLHHISNLFYEIHSLPFNKKHDEMSPRIYNGHLLYAANSEIYFDKWNGDLRYVTYHKSVIDTIDPIHQEYFYPYQSPIFKNIKNYESSSFDFVNNQFFVTHTNYSSSDNRYLHKIFIYDTTDNEEQLLNVREMPINSDEYSIAHPSIAQNSNRIFFASDMPGGFGGMDIYYMDREGDSWSPPINLGATVNTPADEVYPYWHEASQMLYFSSNQKGGYGGLDIYSVQSEEDSLYNLNLLSYLINSPKDDFGIIFNEEKDYGYLVSDREGGEGGTDIYGFKKVAQSITVQVIDSLTGETLKEVEIKNECTGLLRQSNTGVLDIEIALEGKCLISINTKGYVPKDIIISGGADFICAMAGPRKCNDNLPVYTTFDTFKITIPLRKE